MKDGIDLGPVPPFEDCVQPGEPDYYVRSRAECRRYIELLRKKLGPEPTGARLHIKGNLHDFGTYYEVHCSFDTGDDAAVEYAFRCESDGPLTWEDVS